MILRRRILAATLLGACLGSPGLHAVDTTTELEQRYLVQLIAQLDRAQEMARKAEAASDPGARFLLDYQTLEQDLLEIRRALEAHSNAPSRSPRTIEPMTPVTARPRS